MSATGNQFCLNSAASAGGVPNRFPVASLNAQLTPIGQQDIPQKTQPNSGIMKFVSHLLSVSLVSLLPLASCSKAPVTTEQSQKPDFSRPLQDAIAKAPVTTEQSQKPAQPVKATPFRGEVYESIDGLNVITLVSPEELELTEQGHNIICKYTKQDGKLRVVANVMGTTEVVYYRMTNDGLQDKDSHMLYEPGRLLKVRQIIEINKALIAAVEAGDANAAEAQLKKMANHKLLCKGKTLLRYAFDNSDLAMIRVLLDAGIGPNAFDPNGQPAPIPCTTVRDGSTEILKELIRKGANVNLRDDSGHTAFANCMNIWLTQGLETAKSNAIVLFEAGARFSQEDKAGWKILTHGGGFSSSFWNPTPEQEALANPPEPR
jgi:hypothetical protein